ncbi:MAG TPA: hypothetical protein VNO69_03705 [Methyloceanibacter sp.]|nr:hypothetical protein [Methyloceanibacter sp.]
MKPLTVESKKSMVCGFVLREGDFRRLIDLCRDRLLRAIPDGAVVEKYTIKFKNGAIAETDSLDDVLSQENSGGGFLIRVKSELNAVGDEGLAYLASIEFINADEDDELGSTSIKYLLRAADRDWVFVTSSEIAERIERIRRFAPNQIGQRRRRSFYSLLSIGFPLFAVTAGLLAAFLVRGDRRSELAEWVEKNNVHDPVAVLLKAEEVRNKAPDIPSMGAFIGGMFGLLVLAILIWSFFYKYYPVFNFVWGDYVDEFDRLERARRFWLLTIVLGVIVSAVGGLIANNLKIF